MVLLKDETLTKKLWHVLSVLTKKKKKEKNILKYESLSLENHLNKKYWHMLIAQAHFDQVLKGGMY